MVEIPRAEITAVVQTAIDDRQQRVSLRTSSEGELLLQTSPCPMATWVASHWAQLLQVSRIGDAADTACADPIDAAVDAAAMEERRFVHVDQLDVALVSVAVTDARGQPLLGIQRGLSGSRAILAHCFGPPSDEAVPRSARVRFVARTDGSIARVKTADASAETAECLSTRLGQVHLTELPASNTKARVSLTLP